MFPSDPKLYEYLRDLPSGLLLELLADQAGGNEAAIHSILKERGLELEEIGQLVHRRIGSRLPRSHALWKAACIFTVVCTLLVSAFNLTTTYQLLHNSSPLNGLLLLLSVAGAIFGFALGFKLTTHIYPGSRHRLYCGFPLPVGTVDLQTGEESVRPKPLLMLCMAVNASVGVILAIFPLLLLHYFLG